MSDQHPAHPDHAHADSHAWLHALLHHLEHVLPAQAPIRDFVHHNTLHGYQHLPFPQALTASRELTGAQGYLPLERFRALYAEGRIDASDLDDALDAAGVADLAAEVVPGRTRRAVLGTVLRKSIKRLSRSQLRWQIEEAGALGRLQPDLDAPARAQLLAASLSYPQAHAASGLDTTHRSSPVASEAEVVVDLWVACLESLDLQEALRHPEDLLDMSAGDLASEEDVALVEHRLRKEARSLLDGLLARLGQDWSLRSLLLALTGEDLLDTLRPALIRQLASHLDQGLAAWHAPERDLGFYAAWRAIAARDQVWLLNDMAEEWRQVSERLPDDPQQALIQELRLLGLPETRWAGYLERLALELPGWSGMALQRSLRPSHAGSTAAVAMLDFLAVRLILERLYAQRLCRKHWRAEASINGLSWHFHHHPGELLVRQALFDGKLPEYLVDFAERLVREAPHREDHASAEWTRVAHLLWRWRQAPSADRKAGISVSGTAWPLFCLAQHLGLSGPALRATGKDAANRLLAALGEFDGDRAGFIWLLAYERHYREQVFAALAANHGRGAWATRPVRASAQLVWCMDDREEGIRRHLEEIAPDVETLGAAAHFSVFINWRGLGDREVTTLCPVVARPAHAITEAPAPGHESSSSRHVERRQRREDMRYRLLQATRRGLLGAALTSAVAAPVALLSLAGKTLIPSRFAAWNARLRYRYEGAASTRLVFTASADAPAGMVESNRAGFDDKEQADRCQAFLRNIGLTDGFAPLVAIMGHGSNSLNNPHMAAYDCGACSGRHSGPNARLFAAMANRTVVRVRLAERGIAIPDSTWFLAAEHNTCEDSITWYDTDLIPVPLQAGFNALRGQVDAAARAHMQERCRRFASAPDAPSLKRAWRHIQDRRWDWSQARPELGHATNASAVIGRRSVTRGLFLDRRAFLISYDPTRDPEGMVLEGLLLANGPVGAGISLEYYFSTVDNERYGCGTKTVHNVAGYFGVMEGAASDLRTGLPRQMIEIHEAMRLLVVVEHKIEVITAIYQRQPPLQELIGNGWLIVAAKDPDSPSIHLFDPARGWLAWTGEGQLPKVRRSLDWFEGHRDPLPPALLETPSPSGLPAGWETTEVLQP